MMRLFLLLCIVIFSSSGLAEDWYEGVVADVAGEPVLLSDLRKKIAAGDIVKVSAFPAPDNASDSKKALEDEINIKLVMLKAKELELEVEDGDVESQIDSFLRERNLNRQGLETALKEQGVSYADYKESFRERMVMGKFQGRVIRPLINVTQKDVEAAYRQRGGSAATRNAKLTLRRLMIGLPDGGATPPITVQAKRARAAEALEKIRSGVKFAEAVKIYGDQVGGDDGGLMQAVELNELAPPFKAAVEGLNDGDVSNVVETAQGFFIFQLESRGVVDDRDFAQKKRQIEAELYERETVKQLERWISDQRRVTKITIKKEL